MKDDTCIELSNVYYSYEGQKVLESISFKIKCGDYLGIIGPNGGGKTTLLKIILGLIKPSSGKVKVNNRKQLIGYVPQRSTQGDVHFPATVHEIVKSGRTASVGIFRNFSEKDYHTIDHAMKIADVSRLKNRLIGDLSGGQRQRLFIARALAGEPKILILDEPTVGVDIVSQEKFYAFLEELNEKYGITVIFVSHDLDFVTSRVKNVLCLNRSLVCHGSPKEFLKEKYLEKLYGKKIQFVKHGH